VFKQKNLWFSPLFLLNLPRPIHVHQNTPKNKRGIRWKKEKIPSEKVSREEGRVSDRRLDLTPRLNLTHVLVLLKAQKNKMN
jgi:hypothetical protein